jgi:hypothetical protein
MRATFSRIQKLNPELIPPTGSVPFGITPNGHPLYRLVTQRSRAVPDIDLVTGEQRWRKNQMTGEPLYALNKPESYEQVRVFYLASQGNGTVELVDWAPPSAEDVARAQKAQRVAEMGEKLAEALVDSGMEPAELLANLKAKPSVTTSGTQSVNVEVPAATGTGVTYPEMYAPGRWRLSNGDSMQGKRTDAVEAEERVQAARKAAAVTPEE